MTLERELLTLLVKRLSVGVVVEHLAEICGEIDDPKLADALADLVIDRE